MSSERYEMTLPAEVAKLQDVMSFVEQRLEEKDVHPRTQMQIAVSVEEIFVNIASYAYGDKKGEATIKMEFVSDPASVTFTFIDSGMPFDPLAKPDPDVTLSAEERGIGGLGIYMVKKSMDAMEYEYRDNRNILTIRKRFLE